MFKPADLVTLVKTFHEIGFTHAQRLAVLYGSDPHRRARLFASIARLRSWRVQAFADFEAAIQWLSSGEDRVAQKQKPLSRTAKKTSVQPLPA